ncbi:endonuclease domain-containing protein [Mycobacterium noviomagense]|uniref:DUF559 domain-containing protein n=1 Tax=Mycobacterium noviomagense TaxID=459858 RepID=A0A7I7PDI5_9MYCO|nr:hypothetical protein [Mycobacterium noviomagense]ORB11912.1 hypothetical protein BST37_17715 [Mycobacterium noviomagense]BBY06585.1 hypothetical protein MNVI_19030 [Mycobacterium noviomagense]
MAEGDWPFIGTEALADGQVSRRALHSRHRRVYRNVYLPNDHDLTAVTRGVAAWLWSGRTATAAGLSAAALHGSDWIDPRLPAELYRRNGKPVEGIVIHRDELSDDEVCTVRGIPATTPTRTAFDLGRRKGLVRAVIHLDALARATRLTVDEVEELVRRRNGVRGLVQLRRALDLMDGGAESPQETRTRLVLIDAGLPRPQTQIVVCDRYGAPFARIDMGYEDFKVGVEYDGIQHWTDPARRAYDIDKHAELVAVGWRVVRVGANMLRYRHNVIVARTCAALREAGADWPVIARFSLECVS